jgi:hypothetical protein
VDSHDYDGDGKDDLLWRNSDSGQYGMWLMDGLHAKAYRSILDGGSGWDVLP